MKKLIILPVFFAFFTTTFAQTDVADYYSTPSKSKILAKDRISASMSMGAGVSFLNTSKNTSFITYVAPQIGYQLTPKFKLNLGLMHYSITGNTSMILNQSEALINTGTKAVSGNLLSLGGEYNLNKRLILSGAVMMDANGFNASKKDNHKAASLGIEYKTSENSSIKFETTISDGKGNYYNNPNPFSTNGYNSPGAGFSSGMNNSFFR